MSEGSPAFSLPRLDAGQFLADVPLPAGRSDPNRPELEALLVQLSGEVAALRQTVSEQREAIARLKRRADIKPSGRDNATGRPKQGKMQQRLRGQFTSRVSIEDRMAKIAVLE
jgi:hypothetical protein